MIATLLVSTVLCLTPVPSNPSTVVVYSVRSDGAGNACDCTTAPCGQRGPGCEVDGSPCPLLVEPGCVLGVPDECGNLGACAYLDVHAYPGAIPWRFDRLSADGCLETEFQEVAVGWVVMWRLE